MLCDYSVRFSTLSHSRYPGPLNSRIPDPIIFLHYRPRRRPVDHLHGGTVEVL